jgi:hypothetical protein
VSTYLTEHLPELFAKTGDRESFSLVIQCDYDELAITHTRLLAGPFTW